MAHVYWIKLEEHTDMTKEGYIGVSVEVETRFKNHMYYMRKGTHTNPILNSVYKKYGEDKLKMQLVLEGEEDYCYLMEEKLRPTQAIGWNIDMGGRTRGSGFTHSDESKQKMREVKLGKTHSDETKQKIGEAHRGKTRSDESKQKMREAHLGTTHSEETKQKMREAQRGSDNPRARKIEVDGKVYECIGDYAEAININYNTVRSRIFQNPERWGIKIL